jgi:ribonuclease VapC
VSKSVLDASAVLAYLQREPGHEAIGAMLDEARVSAVNIAEVAAKLAEKGASEARLRQTIGALGVEILAFYEALAYSTGVLRQATRHAGLSLGDRACLATARSLGVPAVTTDRDWAGLQIGIEIRVLPRPPRRHS